MSKLKFNYDEMKKIVPNLEDIISDLNGLANQISSMDIPSFSNSISFLKLKSEFLGTAKEIDNTLDNLVQANRILDDFIDSYSNDAKRLPNYVMDKRDSIIKL